MPAAPWLSEAHPQPQAAQDVFQPRQEQSNAVAVSPGHAAHASGFEDHTGIPHAKGEFPAGTKPTSTVPWRPQSCRTIVLNSNCSK